MAIDLTSPFFGDFFIHKRRHSTQEIKFALLQRNAAYNINKKKL